MSFVWYLDPHYEAPFRSDSIGESCVLACDYFSNILGTFVERLPEERLPGEAEEWFSEEPNLAEKIGIIFPNGFGRFDEKKNQNPYVFPELVALSEAVDEGIVDDFAAELCERWKQDFGEITDQLQLLQEIFDFFTIYLQLFVTLTDPDARNYNFKYPPD